MTYTYNQICAVFRRKVPVVYEYAMPHSGVCTLTKDFLTYNGMPGELVVSGFDITVVFPEHLPVKVCEDVYTTLWYWKPIGIGLFTNRQDLFVKERSIYEGVNNLQSKKYKLEAKLRKVSSKIEKLMKEMEV